MEARPGDGAADRHRRKIKKHLPGQAGKRRRRDPIRRYDTVAHKCPYGQVDQVKRIAERAKKSERRKCPEAMSTGSGFRQQRGR